METANPQPPPPSQVALLGLFAAFSYPFACVPFLWFYFADLGITQPQYGSLISIYYVTMVAVEIPTGVLADRFGKRLAMALGPAMLAAGFLIIWSGRSFGAFAVGEVVFGLGHALISGPPSALLFETLRARGQAVEFHRQESRMQALRLLGTGLSFLIGGFVVATWGYGASILLTATLCLGATATALALRDLPPADGQRLSTRHTVLHAGRDLRSAPVLWMLAYFVVLFVLLRFPFHSYQPYLRAAGEEDPIMIGLLFCALNLLAAPCSRLTPWMVARFGRAAVLWSMPMMLAGSMIVMGGKASMLGIGMFFLHQIPFGMHQAVVTDFVQHRIRDSARSTVLSTLSFAGRLAFAAVFPFLVGRPTIEEGYLLTGLLGGSAAVIVLLAGRRFLAK